MHPKFILALMCLFSTSSAQATPGHNAPILLNLSSYHSLDPYQQAINGTIKLHLTLAFTQMSNEMIAALKEPLEEQLHNPGLFGDAIKDIRMDFKEFGLLGNNVVAFYAPKDLNFKDNWKPYQEFIEKIRHLVREMAGQMGNLQYSQKDMVEYGRLGSDTVYTMDIRDPIPHISLKYGGTLKEVQKLNSLFQNGTLQKPKPITLRLNQIELQLTKAVVL